MHPRKGYEYFTQQFCIPWGILNGVVVSFLATVLNELKDTVTEFSSLMRHIELRLLQESVLETFLA